MRMSITVTLKIKRQFHVPASPTRVFEILADVPCSVSHFPKVQRLKDLGDGVYRWELEEIGAAGIHHVVVYACRYVSDIETGSVEWTPIDDVGNGRISGYWQISAHPDGTQIEFRTDGKLQIPGPGLLAPIVAPIVREIFSGLIDEYIANLRRTFQAPE